MSPLFALIVVHYQGPGAYVLGTGDGGGSFVDVVQIPTRLGAITVNSESGKVTIDPDGRHAQLVATAGINHASLSRGVTRTGTIQMTATISC